MPDLWMDVDIALSEVPVNIMPLLDDTDFKTRETAIAYNAAGMDLVWNFVTTGGAFTQTAVTPTTAGNYDWTHQGDGMYTIEIPASGGASINNDTEGFGWFTGLVTGVLPWRGPTIGFRAAGLNDALVDSAYSATRGLAGTALPNAAADAAGGLPISDAGGLDLDARLDVAVSSRLAPTTAGRTLDVTATGAAGIDWANVENPTTAVNLSATNIDPDQVVASVTGAVGSVTGGVTVTTNNDKTGYALSSAGIQAIWDALTSALTTVGSIGKLLVDNINATISSRLASASYTAPLDAAGTRTAVGLASANLDTQLAAIQADTDNIQTRIPAALVGGRMDSNVGAVSGDATAADLLEMWLDGFITGTAQSGDVTYIQLAVGESGVDDIYYGYTLRIVSGTGAGQTASITQYTGVTKNAQVFPTFGTAPDNTSVYLLIPHGVVQADVNGVRHDNQRAIDLSDLLSEYNTDGRIPADMEAINTDTGAAANLEAILDGVGGTLTADLTGNVGGNVGGNVVGTIGGLEQAALAQFFTDDSGQTYGTSVAGSVVKEIADNGGGSGSGLTAIPWNASWDAEVQSEVADALTAYDPPTYTELLNLLRVLARSDVGISTDLSAVLTAINADLGSGGGAYDNTLSGLENIGGLVDQIDSSVGIGGANLAFIPWSSAWDAEVQSEVDDALVARNLDKLIITSGTADSGSTTTMVDAARTEADADYWKGRIILFTSGNISGQCAIITDFNAGTDTFTFAPALTQVVSTQNYVILPGISVWDDTLAEHLIAGSTGSSLNAAGSAGDPWTTSLPGAYGAGTAGKILGDNLNATVSSRATQTSVDVLDDLVDDLETRLTATRAGYLDNLSGGPVATASSISALNDLTSQEVRDSMKLTPTAGGGASGSVDFLLAAIAGDVEGIFNDTDEVIPGLIAALNNISAAQVNAEVDTALADIHLDHLLAADYDPANKPGVATALLNELIGSDAGVSQFTANALELAPAGGGGGLTIADFFTDDSGLTYADAVAGSVVKEIADNASSSGPIGSIEFTYTVINTTTSTPLEGASVWISTDLAGANVIWVGVTDAFGVARTLAGIKPFLDPGTYYFWVQKSGYAFTNPDTETVS